MASEEKRVLVEPEESGRAARRARAILERIGWHPARLEGLALTESSQTYRVHGEGSSSGVLRVMPPGALAFQRRVSAFLAERGIPLPAILAIDPLGEGILLEDLGEGAPPFSPDPEELAAGVRLLARLAAAGRMEPGQARARFPELALPGFPTPARLAAAALSGARGMGRPIARAALDAAEVLASWVGELPRLVVSDLKREHLRFRGGDAFLLDLELASFWDVPPANLATFLSFPGSYRTAVAPDLRDRLLDTYASCLAAIEGPVERTGLLRAVSAAEFFLALSLARAGALSAEDWERLAPGLAPPEALAASLRRKEAREETRLVRERIFRSASPDDLSVETELGEDLQRELARRLGRGERLRILDLGCGEGRAMEEIGRIWPCHRIVGLDLVRGERKIVAGDARALPFARGAFDVVLAIQILQYLPDKLAAMDEVWRVLAPGGSAFFAMTEHFGPDSGLHPSLDVIAASARPEGAIRGLATRRLPGREVLSFELARLDGGLVWGHTWAEARMKPGSGPGMPYLQSRYRATRAPFVPER